jgi:hypothetical protein
MTSLESIDRYGGTNLSSSYQGDSRKSMRQLNFARVLSTFFKDIILIADVSSKTLMKPPTIFFLQRSPKPAHSLLPV